MPSVPWCEPATAHAPADNRGRIHSGPHPRAVVDNHETRYAHGLMGSGPGSRLNLTRDRLDARSISSTWGCSARLPLSFAYAILAHRVFGLRFVFSRSLRYLATTSGTYLILVFGMFIVLYETMVIWPIGLNESNLLPAGIAAVLILVIIVVWTWVKTPIVRYMDQHLFPNEYQNRQRLFSLGRQLTYLKDRDILLERTGQELLECLDLSFAAIYLHEGTRATPSASWYGAREVPGLEESRAVSYFMGNPEWVVRLLQTTSAERPIIEYSDIQTDENLKGCGFELIVTLRSRSERRGIIALGAKLSEEPFSNDEKELLLYWPRKWNWPWTT